MRLSLTLICVLLWTTGWGNPVYYKLNSINKCWSEQKDIDFIPFQTLSASTETDWIRLHLSLVEQTLRMRNTKGLSPQQKANRLRALDYLNEYWHTGAFPQNEEFSHRLPIFIDKYDNFCAVGYLVKATGYEAVSRQIAAETNYAYVREMRYPELFAWAREFGFMVDELAWIQPTYNPSNCYLSPMGKATNGVVNELFVDTALQRLYVGGEFTTVDSAILANNIGYVTESNNVYSWAALGSGLNGPVYAIAKYNNQIFAAGAFSASGTTSLDNVAYWNGSSWQSAGCLNGIVKDLLIYQGDLYAAGQFAVCPSVTNVNFAKWTGTGWQGISGLAGKVNTMDVKDSVLLLGGAFSYNSSDVNAIKWTAAGGFQTFANSIRNEVNDFEVYKDTVYAVCKHTSPTDTTLLKKLYGNTWDSSASVKYSFKKELTYNAACALGDTFMVGGDFYNSLVMGTTVRNAMSVTFNPYAFANWFLTDSTINKMVVFKNRIIAGGAFTYGGGFYGNARGIAVRKSTFPSANLVANVISSKEACKGADGAASLWISGGAYGPYSYKWSTGDTTSGIANLAPGVYTAVVTDYFNILKDTATVTISAVVISKELTQHLNALYVKTYGNKYQWLDCGNNMILATDTAYLFTATKDGAYAAIITKDGCIDTTDCYNVVVTNIREQNASDHIAIYPNPAGNELNISLNALRHQVNISIKDVTGKQLFERQYHNTDAIRIDTRSFNSGIYILEFRDENGVVSQHKIIRH